MSDEQKIERELRVLAGNIERTEGRLSDLRARRDGLIVALVRSGVSNRRAATLAGVSHVHVGRLLSPIGQRSGSNAGE